MSTRFPRHRMLMLGGMFLSAAVFVVYGGSLRHDFVWDDQYLITENRSIRDVSGIARAFRSEIGSGSFTAFHSYRPLQMVSYAFDYRQYGLDPAGYRLTNIILHAATAVAAYIMFARLGVGAQGAFFAALLYALHPVHTEAVTYISGRADSLAALFMLLSLLCYARAAETRSRSAAVVCIITCGAALLSKENAVITPLLAMLYGRAVRKKPLWPLLAALILLTAGYICARTMSIAQPFLAGASPQALLNRVPLFAAALVQYARISFIPVGLHMAYPARSFSATDPAAVAGYVLAAGMVAAAFAMRRRKSEVAFGLLWFLAAFMPVSNILPTNESFMMEHWLYLPLMGLSLAVVAAAAMFATTAGRRVLITALFAASAVALGAATIRQNAFWKDGVSLYERILKYDPSSPRVLNNYCIVLSARGEFGKALPVCQRAVAVSARSASARVNLGNLYRAQGDHAAALRAYEEALQLDPRNYSAHLNKGVVLASEKRMVDAARAFERAAALNPNDGAAYYNAGNARREAGGLREAADAYRAALTVDPYGPQAVACRRNLEALGKNSE